jgi:hypothetical protein
MCILLSLLTTGWSPECCQDNWEDWEEGEGERLGVNLIKLFTAFIYDSKMSFLVQIKFITEDSNQIHNELWFFIKTKGSIIN